MKSWREYFWGVGGGVSRSVGRLNFSRKAVVRGVSFLFKLLDSRQL